MKFYEITITAWRTRGAGNRSAAQLRQLQAAENELALKRRMAAAAEKEGGADDLTQAKAAAEISAAKRAQLLAEEERQAEITLAAAYQNDRVGTKGYQVLNAQGTEQVALVDANGDPFSESVVIEYEVSDTAPKVPDAVVAKWPDPVVQEGDSKH